MNKHLGQEFEQHLFETLRTDDLAVYHYIINTDPSDKEDLASTINDVVLARMGEFITDEDITCCHSGGVIKNPNQV